MSPRNARRTLTHLSQGLVAASLTLSLIACDPAGTGASATKGNPLGSAASNSPASTVASTPAPTAAGSETGIQAGTSATPSFHLAPVTLDEPDNTDTDGNGLSAWATPRSQRLRAGLERLPSAGLTPERIAAAEQASADTPDTSSSIVTVTYTPAQIRAAYGLPTLPAKWTGLSASAEAEYGAGQTIYIVDAYNRPTVTTDLAAFDTKFGLPTCATENVTTATRLPLAAATKLCTLEHAYTLDTGARHNTAPAYNSGWATEINLDVEWAHATAPLARLILIEAEDNSSNGLDGAIALANSMGPGIVSMSWGSSEGSWVTSLDSLFQTTGMSYFAATGDAGRAVNWPSVSQYVVAVGGTSLNSYSGSTRDESVWSGTGGGLSAFVAEPGYQASVTIPGQTSTKMRGVADVAFNADPYTGQFLAITPQGAKTPSWYSAGGTSLATPQWAALAAIANAARSNLKYPLLGSSVHSLLYALPGTSTYGLAFKDITVGNDGTCTTCTAGVGYDLPSGLGTPNGNTLLAVLESN